MEIKVTEKEINDLLGIVSEIPTKYGIPIVNAIQKLWTEKTSEAKEEKSKVDQK